MIDVSFSNIKYSGGFIKISPSLICIVSVEGHALWGIKGNDPLCAAVSALSQTMILTLEATDGLEQVVTQSDGFLKTEIKLLNESVISRIEVILEFFLRGIAELAIIDPSRIAVTFN